MRQGLRRNPGYEKMLALARAMGFPPALWFDEMPGDVTLATPAEGQDLASRVGHLFKTILHPRTGEPYTNAEAARMTVGALAEEDVEGMRTGVIDDSTVGQVAALAAVFGVPASYLMDREKPSHLDGDAQSVSTAVSSPQRRECIPRTSS